MVRYLLGKGCHVGQPTADSSQPLHLAAQNGHAATVQLLLASGARADAVDRAASARCTMRR